MRPSRPIDRHAALLFGGCLLLLCGLLLQGPAAAVQGGNDPTTPPSPVPAPLGFGTADSNGTMIAVTGIDLTGSSVLYLIDTVNRQLAAYQATGGSDSTQGVKLVGARRIDLDLQLEGYNDRSQYTFEQLQQRFKDGARRAAIPGRR